MKLDRNGYAPSILEGHDKFQCYLCGGNGWGKLDRHEIFHGPFRAKSKALGLWVHLCHGDCHLNGVHKYGEIDHRLKLAGQKAAMLEYGWTKDEFAAEFGRNYMPQSEP